MLGTYHSTIYKDDFKVENRTILLDKVETTIDGKGTAHVVGHLGDQAIDVGTIPNASNLSALDLHERVELLLKVNDFGVKPNNNTPKPKRKYTRRVDLGLASDYGKVTLKIANNEPKKIMCYNLYIKGTDKYVYKIDDKGIYVCNGKTKPLDFTAADIKKIRNISDFDVKKYERETKYIKNKIAL